MTVDNNKQRPRGRWDNVLGLMVGVLFSVFLLGLADWEADRQEQVRMAAFRDRLADLAKIAEFDITNRFDQFDDTLLVLREAYVADPTRMAENIRLVRSGPLADPELLVVIVDREGHLAFTDTPHVEPRLYLGDRKYFRFFADGGKDRLYIDEPSFGRVTKRHTLPLARPIYDQQGGFSGVIALSVKQQSLVSVDPRIQLTGDTAITIVNQGGAIVSRSRDLPQMQDTKIAPDLLNPMLEGQEGTFFSTATPGHIGVEHIIAYRHLSNQETQLIVYAESSTEQVLHDTLLQRRVLMGGAGGTSLIVMVLIAVYLNGRKILVQLIDTLQRSKEQEYATLTQTSLDGFLIADSSGRIVDTNTTFCTMLGYTQEEALHLHIADIEAINTPEQIAAHIDAIRAVGLERFPSQFRCKDGAILDVEISAQYVKEAGGRFFTFVRDITERQQAERALLQEKLFSEQLLNASGDTILLFEPDTGKAIRWNKHFTKLSGYLDDEIVKMSVPFDLHSDKDIWQTQDAVAKIFRDGQCRVELSLITKNGTVIPFEYVVTNIGTEDGKTYFLSIGRDITERKRAEQEKALLESKFQQAQKMETVALLAGGVAHDFNNMLGVILGYTELAMDEIAPTQPLFADLKKIYDAAQRSATLTRQLLTFARKQNVTPIVLDLNETVEGMLKMLRRLIGEDIDLSWTPGRGLWSIKMDPAQIDQILANLCVNARDAIAGVGAIAVATGNITLDQKFCAEHTGFVPGDYVKVTVKDSGCGMDQQTITHIFEPFFTTKGVGEGTGLGLATVYGAIKQNNGFIDVSSEPGQGTVFTLYLPRYVSDAVQSPRIEAAAKPDARGHETILLVEDELTLLNMTTTMLQRLGYTVLAANTPSVAIRLASERTDKIHLLATDVIMPGMNGGDLQKQLLAILPGMKSLFISGYTADVIAQQGMLDEGLRFIQKPFTQKELAAMVRKALDD